MSAISTNAAATGAELGTMEDLYLEQLRDLYSAENQIVKALPKMVDAASCEDLQQAFQMHLEQTKGHVERLDEIFDRLGQAAEGVTCKAMQGLIDEAKETLSQGAPGAVMDAALIAAAQRVEHYEISGYGTARTFAKHVGDKDSISLLDKTLDEEKQTDAKLTKIAEKSVNEKASKV